MNRAVIVFVIMVCTMVMKSHATKVFSVKHKNQADVKVFVVKYESQADLIVYKVPSI